MQRDGALGMGGLDVHMHRRPAAVAEAGGRSVRAGDLQVSNPDDPVDDAFEENVHVPVPGNGNAARSAGLSYSASKGRGLKSSNWHKIRSDNEASPRERLTKRIHLQWIQGRKCHPSRLG